ncbi:hypothetical protein Tco_1455061 [Tanacetum coccineum]
MSATLTLSPESLALSLGHFDAVTRNCDAVSTHCTLPRKVAKLLRCNPSYQTYTLLIRGRHNHNKGKISSEVESDTEPVILQTFSEIQALLENSKKDLKDERDEEIYETGEEVDDKTQNHENDRLGGVY